MKSIITSLVVTACIAITANVVWAQGKPETVEVMTRRFMSHEWYLEQQTLWKQEVDRNPANAEAWLNLYKAHRYGAMSDTKTDAKTKSDKILKLVDEMGQAIPNSFEHHYVKWWAGGNNIELFPELEKAYEIRQDYVALSDDFVTYYELVGDYEKMKFFCQKWYQTHEMSPRLLEYNYNVLMSLEPNAILVTVGDNDTYPLWLLQYARGIRTDVTVMNVSLTSIAKYRERMMGEHNIKGDISLLNWERFATKSYDSCVAEFLQNLATSNTERPVYFALTCHPEYLQLITKDLYNVGLANRYSPERIDNIAILKNNWEKFRLDYLDADFYTEDYLINTSWLPLLNMNYVTPAMLLYDHYRLAGEHDRAERFKTFMLHVARNGGREQEVVDYITGIKHTSDEANQQTSTATAVQVEDQRNAFDKSITVFPNPTRETLTVELPETLEGTIQLASLDGVVVREIRSTGRQTHMQLNGLAAGTYLVSIRTPFGSFNRTVQVMR